MNEFWDKVKLQSVLDYHVIPRAEGPLESPATQLDFAQCCFTLEIRNVPCELVQQASTVWYWRLPRRFAPRNDSGDGANLKIWRCVNWHTIEATNPRISHSPTR